MSNFTTPTPEAIERLQSFPIEEMRARRQWVGFKIIPRSEGKPDKKPYQVTNPSELAKSTDPATWHSFDDAVKGLGARSFTVAAYALDGDCVGVDLDGDRWVNADGELTQAATSIIAQCQSYAERSIGGRGLHILLRGNLPDGCRKADRASGVEVYSKKRFFIVTGDQIPGTPSKLIENPQAVAWLLENYFRPTPTERAERDRDSREMTSELSAFSASLPSLSGERAFSVEEIIAQTRPAKAGMRNSCLFDLARGLRYNAGKSQASFPELKPIVKEWHEKALPIISTKSFTETWSDFLRGWEAARFPLGVDVEGFALSEAKQMPPLPCTEQYDLPPVKLLIGMCWAMAGKKSGGHFFLSSHKAGKLLGIHHDKALSYLSMLCADGILKRTEKGNERRANRYRWIAP